MVVAKRYYEEHLLYVILDNYVRKKQFNFFIKQKLRKKSCYNRTRGKIIELLKYGIRFTCLKGSLHTTIFSKYTEILQLKNIFRIF